MLPCFYYFLMSDHSSLHNFFICILHNFFIKKFFFLFKFNKDIDFIVLHDFKAISASRLENIVHFLSSIIIICLVHLFPAKLASDFFNLFFIYSILLFLKCILSSFNFFFIFWIVLFI